MRKNPEGLIFDIQRFSTHDGPGIRTTFFFKGCPLSCSWCHNPESQSGRSELIFHKEVCIDCGRCVMICPYGIAKEILSDATLRRTHCGNCLLCAEKCPSGAIELSGKQYTPEEVVAEAVKDLVFFENSGGGVTISGGEPFYQFDFLQEVITRLKQLQIHVAVETSGYTLPDRLLNATPFIDLFLWDIKITDDQRHQLHTGVPFNPIVDNLKLVDSAGAKTIIRLIAVPGVNMEKRHFENVAMLYNELTNVVGLEIIPYHPLGISKKMKLGFHEPLRFHEPEREEIEKMQTFLYELNNRITIIRNSTTQ